jgi:hypothetical protein
MTPVAAARKRRKFDPKTFLSTIDGGRTIVTFPKSGQSLLRGILPILFFIYKTER